MKTLNKSYFKQYSETAPLRQVIIGRYEDYASNEAYIEIVNEDQKEGLPPRQSLEKEFLKFRAVLEELGLEVLVPEYVGKFVYDQLTPRDIGVVIGNKFVITPMLKRSRKHEVAGIFKYLDEKTGNEPNVLIPAGTNATLEGGDIIVDHPYIYVGLSQRTNEAGVQFLREHFSDEFEIVVVHCKPLENGENILHLDCTFNPVGSKHAIIYEQGFITIPEEISDRYKLINITKPEQQALATNVLSIDEQTIIVRDHKDCKRVNEVLESFGFEIIAIPFDAAPSTGGSFRCCTLPLIRT